MAANQFGPKAHSIFPEKWNFRNRLFLSMYLLSFPVFRTTIRETVHFSLENGRNFFAEASFADKLSIELTCPYFSRE